MDREPLANSMEPAHSGMPVEAEPPTHCGYCGALLNGRYYFCTQCGTPFKHWAEVIPPHRPVQLSDEQLINRKAPQVWTVFWTYVGVLLGVFILTELLLVEESLITRIIVADAAIFLTTCVFAGMYWQSLVVQFRHMAVNWPLLGALALLPVLLGVNFLYHGLLYELLGGEVFDPFTELRDDGVGYATLLVTFCLMPAVTEEIAFRGLVQHWLTAAIKPLTAMILASALFAGLHFSVLSFPYLFAVGMLLGWSKRVSGSLYPPMVLHFLHNWAVIEAVMRWG